MPNTARVAPRVASALSTEATTPPGVMTKHQHCPTEGLYKNKMEDFIVITHIFVVAIGNGPRGYHERQDFGRREWRRRSEVTVMQYYR